MSDRRRVNGPEESEPPVFEDDKNDPSPYAQWTSGQPRHGRTPGDIRSIFLQPGLITQANGSAYIETERTKVICAVYGPRQSKTTTYNEIGKLNVEAKFAPFSCTRRRAPMRDAEDRAFAVQVQQSLAPAVRLELFPKSTIDIFLTIIENDGLESCVAAAAVAASTALADAGIEMVGLVTACAGSTVDGDYWLDPTEDETKIGTGTLVLSCIPALDMITNVWQSGSMSAGEVIECMGKCQERCIDIHSVMAQALLGSDEASNS